MGDPSALAIGDSIAFEIGLFSLLCSAMLLSYVRVASFITAVEATSKTFSDIFGKSDI